MELTSTELCENTVIHGCKKCIGIDIQKIYIQLLLANKYIKYIYCPTLCEKKMHCSNKDIL